MYNTDVIINHDKPMGFEEFNTFIDNQNFSDLKKFVHNAYHPHLGSFFWAFFSNLMPIKLEMRG